jgi:hypothetical protein
MRNDYEQTFGKLANSWFFRVPASDVNPGNANLPIGLSQVAIQKNGVPEETN